MKLYCWQHNATHDMTAGQVEKVVYALSAGYADKLAEPDGTPGDPRVFAGAPSENLIPCPQVVRRWADDSEMYAEHVEQGIECRRAADRPDVSGKTPGSET